MVKRCWQKSNADLVASLLTLTVSFGSQRADAARVARMYPRKCFRYCAGRRPAFAALMPLPALRCCCRRYRSPLACDYWAHGHGRAKPWRVLIEAVAAAKPAVIAVDVLFAGHDTRSPAALARQLGALIEQPELATLGERLPDGDEASRRVIKQRPAVLGFVLDSEQRDRCRWCSGLDARPGADRQDVAGRRHRRSAAAILVECRDAGIGALALPGDVDGAVRRVPLLVADGNNCIPAWPRKRCRVARRPSTYLLVSQPQKLTTGDLQIALSRDGFCGSSRPIRSGAICGPFPWWTGRRQVRNKASCRRVALIGGSAPEIGGLRADRRRSTCGLRPSPGRCDRSDIVRPVSAPLVRRLNSICIERRNGLLGSSCCRRFRTLSARHCSLPIIALKLAVSLGLSIRADLLLDPLTPSYGAFVIFFVSLDLSYSSTRQIEPESAELRAASCARHRTPHCRGTGAREASRRKARGDGAFTDIEDFTAMTRRAETGDTGRRPG